MLQSMSLMLQQINRSGKIFNSWQGRISEDILAGHFFILVQNTMKQLQKIILADNPL
jgi:hypothetical protein